MSAVDNSNSSKFQGCKVSRLQRFQASVGSTLKRLQWFHGPDGFAMNPGKLETLKPGLLHSPSTSVTYPPLPRATLSSYSDSDVGRIPNSPTFSMDSLHLYGLAAAGSVALLGAYVLLRRKPKTADELERERRSWLEGAGRITDGTVIDVQELSSEGHQRDAVMLIYKYDVAGVSYECSQDVTHLRQWINLHSCRLGLHTSVKYDPQNPGNSLVVSENWMGLRQ